jgi:hypothetical protein
MNENLFDFIELKVKTEIDRFRHRVNREFSHELSEMVIELTCDGDHRDFTLARVKRLQDRLERMIKE